MFALTTTFVLAHHGVVIPTGTRLRGVTEWRDLRVTVARTTTRYNVTPVPGGAP